MDMVASQMTHWQSTPSITRLRSKSMLPPTCHKTFKLHSGSLIEFLMKISTTKKKPSYMVGQHVCWSLRIISLIKVWTCESSMQQFIILIHGNRQLTLTHQWLLRSFSWMMMTASLWLMEMLTPSGCTLFTTKLIVKFSSGSGSLSSTITILKQPVLLLNKTVALTISKSFSAPVSEIKRTEGWNHKATSKHWVKSHIFEKTKCVHISRVSLTL